jgi:hypothetical protein
MRRYTKALLLVLVALLYAGSANAYSVEVTGPSGALESAIIDVDVVLDSEGQTLYGYVMQVYYDPMVLSSVGATYHPIAGESYGSVYAYPDNWYIQSTSFVAGGPLSQSIATLVFHVMNVAGSTDTNIVPVVETMMGWDGSNFASSTAQIPLSIHVVPEPTTTMLMGLGLLGILYAGRRR